MSKRSKQCPEEVKTLRKRVEELEAQLQKFTEVGALTLVLHRATGRVSGMPLGLSAREMLYLVKTVLPQVEQQASEEEIQERVQQKLEEARKEDQKKPVEQVVEEVPDNVIPLRPPEEGK